MIRSLPRTLSISEVEKAYFAGLFDADGHIAIAEGQNKVGSNSYWPVGQIGLRSKDSAVLYSLREDFRGNLSFFNNSTAMRWNLSSSDCIRSLYTTLPYLRVKKTEALVALSFWQRYPYEDDKVEFGYKCTVALQGLRDQDREVSLDNMSEEELAAYLAGYFDGDRSIHLADTNRECSTFVPRAQIATHKSSRTLLHEISKRFPGSIHDFKKRKASQMQINRKGVSQRFLTTVLPYLHLKKTQVSLALDYIEKVARVPYKATEKKYALSVEYHDRILALNKREDYCSAPAEAGLGVL